MEVRLLCFSSPFGKNYLAESAFLLKHTSARAARNLKAPPQLSHNVPHFNNSRGFPLIHYIGTQVAHGGQAVEVTAPDTSHYMLKLSYTSNTLATTTAEGAPGQAGATSPASQVAQQSANYPQPIGIIRAYPMSGGRVGLILDGTTNNVELTINPLPQPQKKGYAHSVAYGEALRNHILNIGQITVTSGEIGDILGFQTADLSGPLVADGTTSIDRIAFDAILPGASITTGGDVNTLDVLNGISLSGPGTGISIGRDLNLLNVGTNITLSNGANFLIGRNLGLVSQPPKGTGTGSNILSLNYTSVANSIVTVTIPSIGSFIQGNVIINPGSVFGIGANIYNNMYVEGSVSGFSRLFIFNGTAAQRNPPFQTSNVSASGSVTALGGETP
ncbi:MAG TPA: hypothetical protein VFF52_20005 [Isosphaeraceae bacterium]|nr:hypothetical protein [Isosphaeraceae bacterium]